MKTTRGRPNRWAAWEELLWLLSRRDAATLTTEIRAVRARLGASQRDETSDRFLDNHLHENGTRSQFGANVPSRVLRAKTS
jgi:hypothetical protein